MTTALPWTGERFVPYLEGDIAYEHFHRYALASDLAIDKTVLDIASGEGYGSKLLAQVAKSVVGVDLDTDAVAHASQCYVADNLTFMVGSCWEIPLPAQSVDLVVSFETLEHHDRHAEMMAEISRVLRPDGVLLISTPDKRVYSEAPGYSNPYHILELNTSEFETLLKNYFGQVIVLGQRICHGSIIAPITDGFAGEFVSFRTSCPSGKHCGLHNARYLIGVASNGTCFPPLPSSLFEADAIRTDLTIRVEELLSEVRRCTEDLAAREKSLPFDGRSASPSPKPFAASQHEPDGGTVQVHIAELQHELAERTELIERISASLLSESRGDSAILGTIRDEVWLWNLCQQLRAAVERILPPRCQIAVMSRGDDRLLQLGDRQAIHFPPASETRHAGKPPESDEDAIAQLQAARKQGAEYLLIPAYDLWILGDYPAFGCHLREDYRAITRDVDACMIFRLTDSNQPGTP